jgi:hypothetical protein
VKAAKRPCRSQSKVRHDPQVVLGFAEPAEAGAEFFRRRLTSLAM